MGRKLTPLVEDDRPLTAFVLKLRQLHKDAGAPTLTELATRVGYGQPRLSELFNAKKAPTAVFLKDVVTALEGDPDVWEERLKQLEEQERSIAAASAAIADAPAAHIARLELEIKRLRALTEDPHTVIAQALDLSEQASRRMEAAKHLERRARRLLQTAHDDFERLHERLPEVERKAAAIIADGVAKAANLELQGRRRLEEIVEEANRAADEIRTKAVTRSREMLQTAEQRAKEHRSTAYASINKTLKDIDQLRLEAEQSVQHAVTQRASLEMRAKIEIERLVRQVQERLDKAGASKEARDLETLLMDFNITGSHTATRGRHARQTTPDRQGLPKRSAPGSGADLIVQPPHPDWPGWTFPKQR